MSDEVQTILTDKVTIVTVLLLCKTYIEFIYRHIRSGIKEISLL